VGGAEDASGPRGAARASRVDAQLAPSRISALIPAHLDPPDEAFIAEVKAHVGDVLLVDDGMPADGAAALARLAATAGVGLLRLPANCGKGHAIAAGRRHLLGRTPPPQAVLVLDADGQHPPSAIPALLRAASEAELVIGNRLGDGDLGMPRLRRLTNRFSSRLLAFVTGHPVPDSQCGMRVLRGRALSEVEFPGGRYEAETLHLKRCLRSGVRVAWVPIPALYGGQPSSFRSVRDGARVLGALLSA
jgi:glycosyltransferase involved in cell wall biosynthesis